MTESTLRQLCRNITDADSGNYMKNFESNLPSFLLAVQSVNIFVTVVSTQF